MKRLLLWLIAFAPACPFGCFIPGGWGRAQETSAQTGTVQVFKAEHQGSASGSHADRPPSAPSVG